MGFPTLDGPASFDVDEDLFMVDRDPFGVLVGGLHIPLPIKDDERITLALSLFILDDPDPLDCAVHFEFSAEVFFRDFFGEFRDEEGLVRVALGFGILLRVVILLEVLLVLFLLLLLLFPLQLPLVFSGQREPLFLSLGLAPLSRLLLGQHLFLILGM